MRKNSRKARVYETFQQEGPEAATALGLSLGLANGTCRSWIGTWSKAPAPVTRKQQRQMVAAGELCVGAIVCYPHNPNYTGVVTILGPEVSEVRWKATGVRQYEPNDAIQVLKVE